MADENIQVWDGVFPAANPSAKYSGGDGSQGNPYKISNPTDLAQMSSTIAAGTTTYVNEYFELTDNISLNQYPIAVASINPGGAGDPNLNMWVPIGGAAAGDGSGKSYGFAGIFDGGGFTIHNAFYNYAITNPYPGPKDPVAAQNSVGIFGSLFSTGEIKNLKTAGGFIAGANSVGGIVGRSWGGKVTNCHNDNFVYAVGANGTGGVVGASWIFEPDPPSVNAEIALVVDRCSNSGTVISNYMNTAHDPARRSGAAGGIVGENEGIVRNCWSTVEANVSGLLNAGGIVGSNQDKSSGPAPGPVNPNAVNNCYNRANIGSTPAYGSIPAVTADCAGGIIGFQTGEGQNSYNSGSITINSPAPSNPTYGQIVGELRTREYHTNAFIHYSSGAAPLWGVGKDDSGASASDEFINDDNGKASLMGMMNNWPGLSQGDYLEWTRDTSGITNNGYPYFDE